MCAATGTRPGPLASLPRGDSMTHSAALRLEPALHCPIRHYRRRGDAGERASLRNARDAAPSVAGCGGGGLSCAVLERAGAAR